LTGLSTLDTVKYVMANQAHRLRQALAFQQGTQAINQLTQRLSDAELDRLTALDDQPYAFLLELISIAAPGALHQPTQLEQALIRGQRARADLLSQEGGLLSAADLGSLFSPPLTRQAIDLRRTKGKLIALSNGSGNYSYPAWQLHAGAALPGLEATLAELNDGDPLSAIVFFLLPDPRLKGKRPLDAARKGRVEDVLMLASTSGEHGAI